jgi:uncharacterized protein (DUF2062 family)
MPDHAAVHNNRWLAPFRDSLLHPRLWHLNRRSAAGGVAVGLFCGLLPPPFQMVSAAVCAVLFRINLPLAIFTTLYTNPITFVPLYIAAYWLGVSIVGGSGEGGQFIAPPEFAAAQPLDSLLALIGWLGQLGWPLVIGVLLMASVFAVLGYAAVRVAWRLWLVRHWHRRRALGR